MKNLDFDEFKPMISPLEISFKFLWLKDREIIRMRDVDSKDFRNKCTSCLKWRGELIEMESLRVGGVPYQRCPKCEGIRDLDNLWCDCGEIPHKATCSQGFDIHFLERN